MSVAALFAAIFFTSTIQAAPSTTKTINFQGRLQTPAGSIVPDGHYNIQFKIYSGGPGTHEGNPDGALQWTETYTNNGGTSGVQIRNGYFSVNLGSMNTFGSSIDWDSDRLWLSMNVAGRAAACTTFGNSPCEADGEMLPMKQITATPYAISAGSIDGKTADNFVQLAQGVQTDTSTNTSSIFINKLGSGNIIQLQQAATDVFTVANDGNIVLGNNANKTISIAISDENTNGNDLSLVAGAGGGGAGTDGGDLVLQGGSAGGVNGNGGGIRIDTGAGIGSGTGGNISIGATNAASVTIGRTDTNTTIQGNLQTNNIDTPDSEALNIGSSNATSINLNQDVTIATDKSLTVKGNATINPSTDNLNAFQIQNSASASVLNVSTSSGNILTLGSGSGGTGHVAHATHGVYAGSTTTQRSSTFSRNIAAGHTLIGSLTVDSGIGLPTLTATDSKGNTYSIDASATNSSTAHQFIFSGRITSALKAGDTLTLTLSGAPTRWAWNVEEFDNIVATNRLDQSSTNTGTGTAMSSGATSATTDAHELIFGAFSFTSPLTRIITPGDGFSSSPVQGTDAGSADRGNYVQWKYVSDTGTQVSAATSNTSTAWAAAVATYRTTGSMGISGSIGFSDASGHTGSINVSKLTEDRTYLLPDENGTICLQNSANCGFIQSQSDTDQAANFRIAGTGRITNSSVDAFRVQNTSGTRQFNVDTVSNQVSIGTSDATGTLLVLDTKTNAGDPTGVNGAMYYNSNAGKFRCYESNAWKDCITSLPMSTVATSDTTNNTTTPSDVNGLSFRLAANTKYYYKFVIIHQSAATAAGIGFGVTTPNSPELNNWCVNTTATNAQSGVATFGSWGSYCGSGDASASVQTANETNTNYTSTMEGYIQTKADAGDLQLRMKSRTTSATSVKSGSFGILQVVQ